MKFKQFGTKYILRIDKGEEIVETLKNFCTKHQIKLGSISGIGATNNATIGFFSANSKQFHKKDISEDMEIAPLLGNITTMNGETYLHLHINLGDSEHKSLSGHLNRAVCSTTFEAIIDAIDGEVDREFSEEIGLNLLKFER